MIDPKYRLADVTSRFTEAHQLDAIAFSEGVLAVISELLAEAPTGDGYPDVDKLLETNGATPMVAQLFNQANKALKVRDSGGPLSDKLVGDLQATAKETLEALRH